MDPKAKETVKEGVRKNIVMLQAKDIKDPKPVEFDIKQANKLLLKPNSQWELVGKDYTWNGTELAIAKI
jgi:hypothetical protein